MTDWDDAVKRSLNTDLHWSGATRASSAQDLARGILHAPRDVRRELIEEIAREEGIKYKSAERRLQRYVTEKGQQRRTPGEAMFRRLQDRQRAVQRRRVAQRFKRGLKVQTRVQFNPSPSRRRGSDMRWRNITVTLHGEALDGFTDALAGGDQEQAANELAAAVFFEYGHKDPFLASSVAGGDYAIGEVDEFAMGEVDASDGHDWEEEELPW